MEKHCQDFAVALHTFIKAVVGDQPAQVAAVATPIKEGAPLRKAKPTVAPTSAPVDPKHTAEEVKALCVKVATALKSKDKVRELLEKFGAKRVDDVAKDKLDAAYETLLAVIETKPAESDDEF
jgi:hypothetical protein